MSNRIAHGQFRPVVDTGLPIAIPDAAVGVETYTYAVDEMAKAIMNMTVGEDDRRYACGAALVTLTVRLVESVEELKDAIKKASSGLGGSPQ